MVCNFVRIFKPLILTQNMDVHVDDDDDATTTMMMMLMMTMTTTTMRMMTTTKFYFVLVEVVCGHLELGVDIGWLPPRWLLPRKSILARLLIVVNYALQNGSAIRTKL